MNLKFEVENKILSQKQSSKKTKNDFDDLFCSFVFMTPEWKHLEKYAIFWNRKGKSTIRYLGKNNKLNCELPQMVLNDLYFYVQVYANDDTFTQKLKVFVLKDVPVKKEKEHFFEKRNLNDFFEKMDTKIDNIVYDDCQFLIYSNNKLIKTIDVVDEQLISRILQGITPQLIFEEAISDNSDLPVSCRLFYKALKAKVDISDLSILAYTGSYNDLKDVPEEFPPTQHTHEKNDIINFDESVDEDLDEFINELIENL